MDNEHFTARMSIRRRIARLPVNAANRHLALEEFVAGEHAARRLVNGMVAVTQFLASVRPLFRSHHPA